MNESLIKIRIKLAKMLFNLSEQTATDGTVLVFAGDQLVEGGEVMVYDADGNQIPAPDAVYVMDNGDSVEVTDGIVLSITPKEAPVVDITVDAVDVVAPEAEIPEPQDTEVLIMVQELLNKVAELDAICAAMEASMGGMSETVTKMSKHIPTEELKQTVSLADSKMAKSTEAAGVASRILSA